MAYKCKRCGKFVAKDAKTCKYCGQEDPAELVEPNTAKRENRVGNIAKVQQIQCPNCGSLLNIPKQFEKDYYLTCGICNQQFANPLKAMGRGENFLKKHGCLIFLIFIAVVAVVAYFSSNSTDNIIVDGKSIYVITKDYYAPSDEATAKKLINAAVENRNDAVGQLEFYYDNANSMTHLFQGDRVVVVKLLSSGYKLRKLSDFKTAIVPDESYLKKE